MQLTKKNYHSIEADHQFMSRSQYLNFLNCEAAEIARLKGEWAEEKTDALLVGSYVHAWNEDNLPEFKAAHPEMFATTGKNKGELKSPFQCAERMIKTLAGDPLIMMMLNGQKEAIITADFAGVTWKAMLDVKNAEKKRIVDLKTTRSIRELSWSVEENRRVSFVEAYKYVFQAAIYSELDRIAADRPEYDWHKFYIVAVSKEDCPDKEVIDMWDPERWVRELEAVKLRMPRILQVKAGEVEPYRCEKCSYCRSTRKLTRAIHYSQLEGEKTIA